jgi:hypothetical protein
MKIFRTILLSFSIMLVIYSNVQVENSGKPDNGVYQNLPENYKYTGLTDSEIYDIMIYNKVQNFIAEELEEHPNHLLMKNDLERFRVAKVIVDSARNIDTVTWELLFAVIRYESSFKHRVMAKDKPSIGMMQLHGRAWSYCSEALRREIDKTIIEDQVICGGLWLDHAISLCNGRVDQGLARYATGYMCDYSSSNSVTFIVTRRMNLVKKLRK